MVKPMFVSWVVSDESSILCHWKGTLKSVFAGESATEVNSGAKHPATVIPGTTNSQVAHQPRRRGVHLTGSTSRWLSQPVRIPQDPSPQTPPFKPSMHLHEQRA